MPPRAASSVTLPVVDLPTLSALFDRRADVVFFVKDREGRYVAANRALAERLGLANSRHLLGQTAEEVFPSPFGSRYAAQDLALLRSGSPLVDCLEIHLYPSRQPGWCVTNKLPLKNAQHEVTGLIGVSEDLRLPDYASLEFSHVAETVAWAEANLERPLSLQQLADRSRLSPYQFDRRIRRVFGMTSGQWLNKLRMDVAERRLRETDESIAAIALETGYGDQSAFTRQFRRMTGLTPRDYRIQARRGWSNELS